MRQHLPVYVGIEVQLNQTGRHVARGVACSWEIPSKNKPSLA